MPKKLQPSTTNRASPYQVSTSQQTASPRPESDPRPAALWADADDKILVSARASGLNWQPIAATHFPKKTANACRKRHERLMERRQYDAWDHSKLDRLAKAYMECRQDMWSILSAKLDERWVLVEAKCMEKGLKNLQVMARAAAKRDVNLALLDARDEETHDEGGSGTVVSDEDGTRAMGGDNPNPTPSASPPPSRRDETETSQVQWRLLPLLPLYQPPASLVSRNTRLDKDDDKGGSVDSISSKRVRGAVTVKSMLSDLDG